MNSAWGCCGRWGDPEPKTPIPVSDIIATALPAIQTISEELSDPFRRAEVLEAKLANARARGAASARIRVLEAKLGAARRTTGLRMESEQSTRDWRMLGKTGVTVGIGVGVALIVLLLSRVRR